MKLLFFIFLLTLPFLHSLDLEVFKQKMLENYQIVHSALLASRSQFQSDSERSVPPNTPNTERSISRLKPIITIFFIRNRFTKLPGNPETRL